MDATNLLLLFPFGLDACTAIMDMISEGDTALWLQHSIDSIDIGKICIINGWEWEMGESEKIILNSIERFEVIRVDKICISTNLCAFHLPIALAESAQSEDSDIYRHEFNCYNYYSPVSAERTPLWVRVVSSNEMPFPPRCLNDFGFGFAHIEIETHVNSKWTMATQIPKMLLCGVNECAKCAGTCRIVSRISADRPGTGNTV